MIFDEKLLIGESVDFSYDFWVYIGRKWFGLWVLIWDGRCVKVLIFVRFYDIGCDIWILGVDLLESGDFVGFVEFWLWV